MGTVAAAVRPRNAARRPERYPLRVSLSRTLVALALLLSGCAPRPPARWAEGGARIVIPTATLKLPEGAAVEIRADGRVLEDGDVLFAIDRAGRVFTDEGDPIAVLGPDGLVEGPDGQPLGRIGRSNAAPPGSATAWLAVLPDGLVVHFAVDGERTGLGAWEGCGGPALRTCTLVTHLILYQRAARAAEARSGFGFGVGVGVYR